MDKPKEQLPSLSFTLSPFWKGNKLRKSFIISFFFLRSSDICESAIFKQPSIFCNSLYNSISVILLLLCPKALNNQSIKFSTTFDSFLALSCKNLGRLSKSEGFNLTIHNIPFAISIDRINNNTTIAYIGNFIIAIILSIPTPLFRD